MQQVMSALRANPEDICSGWVLPTLTQSAPSTAVHHRGVDLNIKKMPFALIIAERHSFTKLCPGF
jgi:hypothetical protein